LLAQFESRIKKTESDKEQILDPQRDTQDYEVEDEEEEDEEEDSRPGVPYYLHEGTYSSDQDPKKYYIQDQIEYPENYSDQNMQPEEVNYETNDYENAVASTYAKAKKYKRKAKKLYKNLEKMKAHYSKAKKKINGLENENTNLSDQLMMFSERVRELENLYQNIDKKPDTHYDPRIEELSKENEFLKRENRRLTS